MENTFECERCLKSTHRRSRNKQLWQHCELEYCQECGKEFIEENNMEDYLKEIDYETKRNIHNLV